MTAKDLMKSPYVKKSKLYYHFFEDLLQEAHICAFVVSERGGTLREAQNLLRRRMNEMEYEYGLRIRVNKASKKTGRPPKTPCGEHPHKPAVRFLDGRWVCGTCAARHDRRRRATRGTIVICPEALFDEYYR